MTETSTTMQAAHKVFTEPMLFLYIVGFQPGVPFALIALEPEVYKAQKADPGRLPSDRATLGPSLFHHALLTDNSLIVDRLFRLREEPYYAAMPQFALDGLLEKVCQRGSVKYLTRLHGKPGVPASWSSDLQSKAEWLMQHHPEASGAVDLSAFARFGSQSLDVSLLELLLLKYPRAVTPELVELCALYGNLEAVKFFHHHANELPEGFFTPGVMDAATMTGHLDIVRFLHGNRTEGCTQRAFEEAVQGSHLDVVKFLHENRMEEFYPHVFEDAARYGYSGSGDLAMTKYLVEHCPEAIQDPTRWPLNKAVKLVRSVWATSAITSDDAEKALRAAVILLTDVNAFEKFHDEKHPAGCGRRGYSLLQLAIQEQNDAIVEYLVGNCELVRNSIGFYELFAASFDHSRVNLKLLELLMAKMPRGKQTERIHKDVLRIAAERSNMPVVKMLLGRGVACSETTILQALRGECFGVAEYLMETYPRLMTMKILREVASRREHEFVFKLHDSRCYVWDASVIHEILCASTSQARITWEAICSLHERCSSIPLNRKTARCIWTQSHIDVLKFMWFVWRDPKITSSFAGADREDRLRLYSRMRWLEPSMFADVPDTLPWGHQLLVLRQKVESRELTLADLERAYRQPKSPATRAQY